jgi:hypothetical protein
VAASAPYRLVFQPDPALRAAAFDHEASVFDTTYGVPLEAHIAEFAPYEAQSAFLVVVDGQDEVRATMRLITPGPTGLKTIVDASLSPWFLDAHRAARAVDLELATTWDVATLAVGRRLGADRTVVTAALYHGLTVAARRNRVSSLLMTVDERVRGILQTYFGLFTTALPGATPQPFEGSAASTPVFGHCSAMLAQQRRRNPEAYRLITLGLGLERVAVPTAPHFDLLERAFADAELAIPTAAVGPAGPVVAV